MEVVELGLSRIRVGEYEQRFSMDDERQRELVGSIKRLGVLEPLHVRASGDEYVVLSGHRRRAAAVEAGLALVPCIIEDGDEAKAAEVTFAANFFRQDLSPVELAVAIANEYESGRMTVEQLADGFRRSKDWVARQLAVTHWPEDVLAGIHEGGLSLAAAANLAQVTEEEYRVYLVRQAVENGASARATSAWLQAWRAMLPPSEAVEAQPVAGRVPLDPLVPQAPCLCCGHVKRVDCMSHVPICSDCVQRVRKMA